MILSAMPEKTNCQFLFVKIRVIRGQRPLFIPIRFLIKKPADDFIGKARENQLPISFREN
ncbi:MAG: hypothetical protein JZU72_03315 [Chlorobium phaeobacteroides]|jgi:hypothetical protein|nr:hypothetical protein [Chlorobium phaeobacteroides]